MLPDQLKRLIQLDDSYFSAYEPALFYVPQYDPTTHYVELTRSKYFYGLIILRHHLKAATDYYFCIEQQAKNVDLFMLTPSVSSPSGLGSNSVPIPLRFGVHDAYLTDSSQFGFEPLLMNEIEKAYCYMPSMRGEDCDKRHLNQFFHCEAEIRGGLEELIPLIEEYIRTLAQAALEMPGIVGRLSASAAVTMEGLRRVQGCSRFPEITFDAAIDVLIQNGRANLINFTKSGRDISAEGELELMRILGVNIPLWVRNHDRDRVPFYQRPDPDNPEKVIDADLLFPQLTDGSFGGEIVGCGQRQIDVEEMMVSLARQGVDSSPYEWYLNLRRQPSYRSTSGFGLGVERFIAWFLCRDDIKDVIVYPRLKNVPTFP